MHWNSKLTHELNKENDVDVDEDKDRDEDPVKVPKRRLSTLFNFFAVWALFLVF